MRMLSLSPFPLPLWPAYSSKLDVWLDKSQPDVHGTDLFEIATTPSSCARTFINVDLPSRALPKMQIRLAIFSATSSSSPAAISCNSCINQRAFSRNFT
jgi:hypothetical protein